MLHKESKSNKYPNLFETLSEAAGVDVACGVYLQTLICK
jgi:hypothetical protein